MIEQRTYKVACLNSSSHQAVHYHGAHSVNDRAYSVVASRQKVRALHGDKLQIKPRVRLLVEIVCKEMVDAKAPTQSECCFKESATAALSAGRIDATSRRVVSYRVVAGSSGLYQPQTPQDF